MSHTATSRSLSYLAALGVVVGFVVFGLAVKLLPWFGLTFLPVAARELVSGGVALSAVVLATWWLQRRREEWASSSLVLVARPSSSALLRSLGALLVGGVLFGLVWALTVAFGGLQVAWKGIEAGPLLRFLFFLFFATLINAAWEEYTFRGWAFSAAVRAFGPHKVALAVGVVFGLVHLLNPHWNGLALVSISIAGWLLGYTMLAFGDILVPIGLHTGWNLAQSLLMTRQLWTHTRHESVWLSGGRHGLEASAAGLAMTALAATLAFVLFLRRRRSLQDKGAEG